MAAISPVKISLVFAFLKQSKVLMLCTVVAHEATPPTKFVQSICRRAAVEIMPVAAIPDWNICVGGWGNSGITEQTTYRSTRELVNV